MSDLGHLTVLDMDLTSHQFLGLGRGYLRYPLVYMRLTVLGPPGLGCEYFHNPLVQLLILIVHGSV